MLDLFFSYSHEDEDLRNELEIHLAMLKRQGLIRAWHDRRIPPGEDFDAAISEQLETANIILLLVSPYFLASKYCYEVEMTRALERHRSGEAVVLPVILQPCDWQHAPFGKLRATPPDGNPVAKFANVHDAFLQVTKDIRWAAEKLGVSTPSTAQVTDETSGAPTARVERSSNLRVKKSFTDRQRDAFADETFAYIRRFFESSLEELAARNPEVEHRFKSLGDTAFTASVYVSGEKRAACTIWLPGDHMFGGAIAYSADDAGPGNSMNDSMSVEDDGYRLGMKPLGLSYMGRELSEPLTEQGAAEYFWSVLISFLQ